MDHTHSGLSRARRALEGSGRFPGGALPGDISDSWTRSLSHGIDPLARPEGFVQTARALADVRSQHADLIRFARPELEVLYDQIAGSNFMIALGAPDGVVLDTLTDTQFGDSDAGRAVIPGSVWTEEARGTNALGLCIATGRPAQVYGGEHFLRAHQDVSCISAPIFDGRGKLAGVLDASSGSTVRQQHTAALVQMSASNIENSLIRSGHDRRIVVVFHPRPEYLSTLSVGMLVLDDDFRIHAVNRKGLHFLTGFGSLIGTDFAQVFDTDFATLIRRLLTGETLRVRDRMGSAVSMRCVANRATFAMAGRGATVHSSVVAPSPNLFRDIVIEDPSLRRALATLPAAAQRGAVITIIGETGTGKEVTARLAHAAAARSGDFVAVDPRSLSGDVEASIFGQSDAEPGLLARADRGTLYFDEVTALPPVVQAALIRVLDVGEYRRVGESQVRSIDALIVVSSSRTLEKAVEEGKLRADLRFRLEGYLLILPPLRERSDFTALVLRLLATQDRRLQITPSALGRLAAHDWPGNIHELRGVLERAEARCLGESIGIDDIDGLPDSRPLLAPVCPACEGSVWKEQQCRSIRSLVNTHGGSISKVARQLGVSRTTVYKHLEERPFLLGSSRG